jgi:hypothetical protein
MTTLYVVAVYVEDRNYGGPEEGGWWYTAGELDHIESSFLDEDDAWVWANAWNEDRPEEQGWRYAPSKHATVVELPRRELKYEVASQICHSDWDVDEERDYEWRWDVPTYYPEARPHYC